MVNALASTSTVAFAGRSDCEVTLYRCRFLRTKLDSRAITTASTIVHVANNKWRQLWNRTTSDNLEQFGALGRHSGFFGGQG